MKEQNAARENESDETPEVAPRELFVMRAGGRFVAVFADEVDSVASELKPTPLPHAPACVLGVVQMRGRIRTVINPLPLLPDTASDDTPPPEARTPIGPRIFVALRGDEQLALAVEQVEENAFAPALSFAEPADAAGTDASESLVRAVLQSDSRPVLLLNTTHLFETAMRGTERRRPRS